jgi:hypothetical protein
MRQEILLESESKASQFVRTLVLHHYERSHIASELFIFCEMRS